MREKMLNGNSGLSASGLSAMVAVAALFATAGAQAQTVPLGNLFDDFAGTSLNDAIASDTFGAPAEVGDLGIAVAQAGAEGIQTIAPGVLFDFTNVGGGATSFTDQSTPILNDAPYSFGGRQGAIQTTGAPLGVYHGSKIEDGVGMHANALVTFNLNDLRAAGGPGTDFSQFTGEGGLNDDAAGNGVVHAIVLVSDATSVLAGYINGQQVDVGQTDGIYSFTGAIPAPFAGASTAQFTVPLTGASEYLTLVTTEADGSIGSDQAVFSEAQLTIVPEPASLGLIALGAVALIRRRRA